MSVPVNVDWKSFFKPLDLSWDAAPENWLEGPFFGGGLVGTIYYADLARNRIRFWVCRSDVGKLDYDGGTHDPIRTVIGTLDYYPGARIIAEPFEGRLDLWNAESRDTWHTERGVFTVRCFAPSGGSSFVVEIGGDPGGSWQPAFIPEGELGATERERIFHVPDRVWNEHVGIPSGGFAVAWSESAEGTLRRLSCAVGSTPNNRRIWNPGDTGESAREEALKELRRLRELGPDRVVADHRAWWHDFYRNSFFSISNRELESHYWIQLYKLASSTRADRPMIDNHGIWTVEPSYGFATWDYNVQSINRFQLGANHAELSRPFLRFMEDTFNEETMRDEETAAYRAGVSQRTFLRYLFLDTETWHIPHKGPQDGPAKLLWAAHTYAMHHWFLQDDALLDHLLLLVDAATETMINLLEEEDGRLVIPFGQSWECGKGKNPTGYLASLRWGLATAVDLAERLGRRTEKIGRWRDVLARLADYPTGPEGFWHTEELAPMPHRHWTHLMSLFPYDMLEGVDRAYRRIAYRSLEHFAHQSCGLDGTEGQSFAHIAAMIMYAMFADPAHIPRLADNYLHYRGGRAMNVSPTTMYKEYGPVVESPVFFANAVQECIVMTRSAGVHLFPALPDEWGNVLFHHWRCGGGFLVSGERRGGEVRWIEIESPDGGTATFHLPVTLRSMSVTGSGDVEPVDPYTVSVRARPGDHVTIARPDCSDPIVHPVLTHIGAPNPFGKNATYYALRPQLSDPKFRSLTLEMQWDDAYRRHAEE